MSRTMLMSFSLLPTNVSNGGTCTGGFYDHDTNQVKDLSGSTTVKYPDGKKVVAHMTCCTIENLS